MKENITVQYEDTISKNNRDKLIRAAKELNQILSKMIYLYCGNNDKRLVSYDVTNTYLRTAMFYFYNYDNPTSFRRYICFLLERTVNDEIRTELSNNNLEVTAITSDHMLTYEIGIRNNENI